VAGVEDVTPSLFSRSRTKSNPSASMRFAMVSWTLSGVIPATRGPGSGSSETPFGLGGVHSDSILIRRCSLEVARTMSVRVWRTPRTVFSFSIRSLRKAPCP